MKRCMCFCLLATVLLCSGCLKDKNEEQMFTPSMIEKISDTNATKADNAKAKIKTIDIYGPNALALAENGDLWSWGSNHWGLVGDGRDSTAKTPVKIMGNIKRASFHYGNHATAITKNGELWVWGNNSEGQLGNGTTIKKSIPIKIADNVRETCDNSEGTAYIKENGELYVCGYNATGKLGVGHCNPVLTPVKIMDGVKTASLKNGMSYAIKENGELWTWGDNKGFIFEGILGNGSTEPSFFPRKILEEVESVSSSPDTVFIYKKNGELWGYGSNYLYQLCDGTNTPACSPQKIMDDVIKVYHSLDNEIFVLKKNGDLLNLVGNESNIPPRKILDGVKEFYLFPEEYKYAIKNNGELWAWGAKPAQEGLLYINDDSNTVNNPVKIFDNVTSICCSSAIEYAQVYILTEHGEVWGIGDGPLGNGEETSSQVAVKIMDNIKKFFKNNYDGMTYVMDISGEVWGFGISMKTYGNSLYPIEFKF